MCYFKKKKWFCSHKYNLLTHQLRLMLEEELESIPLLRWIYPSMIGAIRGVSKEKETNVWWSIVYSMLLFINGNKSMVERYKTTCKMFRPKTVNFILLTYQLDDLNENPVISRGGHEFEEERCQRQVVLGISPSQFTDNIYCCRLDT